MTKLFTPLTLRGMTLKNRIMMAPMCMYSADGAGHAGDWHRIHYATRAEGGAGLVMVEATAVEARGRISERDLGIWEDGHTEGLERIARACHERGAKAGIQLAHAGRKSETSGEPIVAPSALPYSDEYGVPQALSKEEIGAIAQSFAAGAERALRAGFDIIEIHGAHGYLISEFLSPLTNRRDDEYGGGEEGRSRFLKEVIGEVRKVWPAEKPLGLRVSAEDYGDGGNGPEAVGRMIGLVKGEGLDVVDVSSGGVVPVSPPSYPGYQIRMAEIIGALTGLPVIAGGLVTTPEMAAEILENRRADMVFLGRELLRSPYWPLRAAAKLRADVEWPRPYERGRY